MTWIFAAVAELVFVTGDASECLYAPFAVVAVRARQAARIAAVAVNVFFIVIPPFINLEFFKKSARFFLAIYISEFMRKFLGSEKKILKKTVPRRNKARHSYYICYL